MVRFSRQSHSSRLLWLCCLLTADTAYGAGADRDMARLDALLADMVTLSAEVEQFIIEEDGGVLETSQILMHLKRPGGFYWETLEPFPELIVTDGETLWNYQPDLEQVVIEPWDAATEELAAKLLSGRVADLSEEYAIRHRSTGTGGSRQEEFLLAPYASDSPYSEINLSFLGGDLDLIYLRSKNGQRTVWRFHAITRNPKLAADLFRFTPPPGIEVINNTYTP